MAQAHARIRFLRLTRLDTRDALIVPITHAQLTSEPRDVAAGQFAWNGSAAESFGGLHLGIVEGPRLRFGKSPAGVISVLNQGLDDFAGSGFGHKIHAKEKQCWCWRGKVLPATVFEIAVAAGDLTANEERLLLGLRQKSRTPILRQPSASSPCTSSVGKGDG